MIFKTIIPSLIKYSIDLSTYDVASEIGTFCRRHGIVRSVYTFTHIPTDTIMKIGKTEYGASNGRNDHGERIWRQAGNIPGWDKILAGNAGKEMIDTCNEFTARYKIPVTKNDIRIDIHDMTRYPFWDHMSISYQVAFYESELLKDYNDTHGYLPSGNKKAETRIYEMYENMSSAHNLFNFSALPEKIDRSKSKNKKYV